MLHKMPQRFATAALLLSSFAVTMAACGAEQDNPLNPAHQTPQQMEFWKGKIDKMDTKNDGKVTQEGYLKYYSELWDKHAPAGKADVSIDQLAAKWASMEQQNPLDPEYKSALWRNEHVKAMDANKDRKVSKTEFLAHMETHWAADAARANAVVLTREQIMEAITNPLDPRYHTL